MSKSSFLLAASLVVLGASAASATDLVTNGDFNPGSPTTALSPTGTGEIDAASGITSLPGWTEGQAVYLNGSTPQPFDFILDANANTTGFRSQYYYIANSNIQITSPSYTLSGDGGSAYAFGSDGSYATGVIYQDISGLTPGDKYTLSFYIAGARITAEAGTATNVGWDVGFDSTVPGSYGSSSVGTYLVGQGPQAGVVPLGGFVGWEKETVTLTATSASEYLSFFATGAGMPPFSLLDGVSLTPDTMGGGGGGGGVTPAVPEPSTWAMMLAGFAGLVVVARRRRKVAATAA